MRQEDSRSVFAHWLQVRGARLAPERADIDPVVLRQVLKIVLMLEVDDQGQYCVGLSGTGCNELFGRELRHTFFIECWREADQSAISEILNGVCEDVQPMILGFETAHGGETAVPGEALLLPLRHNGKTHSRILATISLARRPSWQALLPAPALSLRSMRALRPAIGAAGQFGRTSELPMLHRPISRPVLRTPQTRDVTNVVRYGRFTVYEGGRASSI